MDKKTKLTLNELVKRKAQIQESRKTKKTQNLYIKSLDGVITIEEASRNVLVDTIEMEKDDVLKSQKYLLYNCIVEPNVKDKSLQEEFECIEPYDIVDKIFSTGEIGQICNALLSLSGYTSGVEVVEDIKNS